jgi:hypothetical protein
MIVATRKTGPLRSFAFERWLAGFCYQKTGSINALLRTDGFELWRDGSGATFATKRGGKAQEGWRGFVAAASQAFSPSLTSTGVEGLSASLWSP